MMLRRELIIDFYRKIANEAPNFLSENGFLLLEIGYDQANKVTSLLKENGFKNIEVIKDLNNNDRVVVANYQKGE